MKVVPGLGSCRRGLAIGGVFCVLVVVLSAMTLAGCTSEAELVEILSTEGNGAARAQAAEDLARRYSYEATQLLVEAAEENETAALAVDALAVAYGDLVREQLEEVEKSGGTELGGERTSRLSRTLVCLRSIGSDQAIKELVKLGTGLPGDDYLDGLRGRVAGELAVIGYPAVGPLMAEAAGSAWARTALAGLGEDALPCVLAVLGTDKWAEEVLAGIGLPAIQPVAELLGSTDPIVVHRAIGALLRMYDHPRLFFEANDVIATAEMAPTLLADLSNEAFERENEATRAEGFDHEDVAQQVLLYIGEPAVEAVVASSYDGKWYVLAMLGAPAVPALKTAMNGSSRDDSLQAAMALVCMGRVSPSAVDWLSDALTDRDLRVLAENYLYFLVLAQPGSEIVLADALFEHGSKQMGLDCMNCGNDFLEAAGREWCEQHGYLAQYY